MHELMRPLQLWLKRGCMQGSHISYELKNGDETVICYRIRSEIADSGLIPTTTTYPSW